MVLLIRSNRISRVPPYFSYTPSPIISTTGVSPSSLVFPKTFVYSNQFVDISGSSSFARHYSQNRCYFLFLTLLRYFNSGGLAYLYRYTYPSSMWVCPFGFLRIVAYLLLPEAFRRSSRPSSPSSAYASTVRPFFLTLF